ncbi:hypothetical protein FHS15_003896 [Paenibacillus castaneae]|nr:hypothetical protein [Paenibacillus castaneae]
MYRGEKVRVMHLAELLYEGMIAGVSTGIEC